MAMIEAAKDDVANATEEDLNAMMKSPIPDQVVPDQQKVVDVVSDRQESEQKVQNVSEKEESSQSKLKQKKKKGGALPKGGVAMFGGVDLFGGKNPFAHRRQEPESEE